MRSRSFGQGSDDAAGVIAFADCRLEGRRGTRGGFESRGSERGSPAAESVWLVSVITGSIAKLMRVGGASTVSGDFREFRGGGEGAAVWGSSNSVTLTVPGENMLGESAESSWASSNASRS